MIENGVLYIVGLQISISEFIWTIISFFPFMFLLKKFLYDPVLKHIGERTARIEAGLKEGSDAEKALESNKAALAEELSESSKEARAKISEARSEAEREKSEVLAGAHSEASKIQHDVRSKVEQEENEARESVESCMPELVALLTNRLLKSDDLKADSALVEDCIGANKE